MDFALVLAIAVSVTGLIWLLDLVWRKIIRNFFVVKSDGGIKTGYWVVEYARAFFPVLLIVFALRSFVVEPFRIPSGSMLPTLQIGDFILVNKFKYGIRLPIVDEKILEVGTPEHGDVMVFKYPQDRAVNFIKRVVGLPGDTVTYADKKLYVNGNEVAQDVTGTYIIETNAARRNETTRLNESFRSGETHSILIDENRWASNMEFMVPEGHYFVMGDNRDYSNDSRFWGFVPEENLIGKAFFIWFSWDSTGGNGVNWSRIAAAIE